MYIYIYIYILGWGFPGGSDNRETTANAGDWGSIPRSGRGPGEGNGLNCSSGLFPLTHPHRIWKYRTANDLYFLISTFLFSSRLSSFNLSKSILLSWSQALFSLQVSVQLQIKNLFLHQHLYNSSNEFCPYLY